MRKFELGKTGLMVTRIGFGGIPIQRCTEDEAVAIVKKALDLGINFIDTSRAYSTSEERIGKAISRRPRKSVILATKSLKRTREEVQKDLETSLKNLNVKYVDLYQFHQVSDSKDLTRILDPNGPFAFVQEAKKAGLVKHIGITSHSMDTAKEAVRSNKFETLMYAFNFITPEVATELVPLCRERNVGLIAMKPLSGGMVDNVSIAFKYLLQFPDVLPIVGIQRPEELDPILHVVNGPLEMTPAEVVEMERIRKQLGSRFCHRCDYCQPCTENIQISSVFHMRSMWRRFPPERVFAEPMQKLMDKAVDCSDCGKCEERCPYNLPIRQMLKEESSWYRAERKTWLESKAGK
ncbi:MAG: aldo/keto reductase [Chloroflexota bacterium]